MLFFFQAIACRQDLALDPADQYPFGAIDAKVTSVRLATGKGKKDKSKGKEQQQQPIVLLKMGPTTSNHQPPFCWSEVRIKHSTSS